jgi:hypothetical protein
MLKNKFSISQLINRKVKRMLNFLKLIFMSLISLKNNVKI